MSHIVDIELVITDLDAAIAACKELGGTFHRGQTTHRWYGKFMGDYATTVPVSEMGKCDHAMSWPDAGYEVGLKKQKDGTYRLQFDFYGEGLGLPLLKHIGGEVKAGYNKQGKREEKLVNGGCKFRQLYGLHKVMLEAKKKGQTVTRKTLPNGAIALTVGVR
jgi:hypothetical protein